MHQLDRTSPVPLYLQLRDRLLAYFEANHVAPGDRVPGDTELCAMFGVSRTVVRQTLTDLEYAGVVERIKGKGTFYATPKVGENLAQSLTGLFEDMATRGIRLESDVRRLDVVPADAQVSEELQLDLYDPVILLERLRKVKGEPWALNITHIPFRIAPDLLNRDFRQSSLYEMLENDYGIKLAVGRRSIEASVADSSLATLLTVPKGAPVLVLRSISFDVDDRPVESFVAFHRGDRSRFEVELARHPDAQNRSRPLVVMTTNPPSDDE